MKCPRCHDKSEVLETRHTRSAIRRRRRCLNPRCNQRFTTTESTQLQRPVDGDEAAARARIIAKEFGSKAVDRDALEAALAVDMRRAQIARQQKAAKRQELDTWYDNDDGFEPAPSRLDEDSLKRELGD